MKLPKRKLVKLFVLLVVVVVVVVGGMLARKIIRRARTAGARILAPVSTGPRTAVPLEAAEMIYDGKLTSGWDDWGWGPHRLGEGSAKLVLADYGGWLLHHSDLSWRYGGVSFRFKAPTAWGDFLQVNLRQTGKPDDSFPIVNVAPRHIAAVESGWQEVLINWKELNPERQPFDRLLIAARSKVSTEPAQFDRVMLTKADASETVQGQLKVLCDAPTHPISELIYGSASPDWSSGQTAERIGGNPLSRDNWDIGAWNTGNDWFFENHGQDSDMFHTLATKAKEKRTMAVVVPMLGWVAKDKSSVGFPRSKFASQRKYDPYNAEAGDGFDKSDKPIAPGDPAQTSIAAPPELIAIWVRKVRAQDEQIGTRSVHLYILDNEPTLWSITHRDVHPQPLSYDELLDRTIKYASAIRDADPDAVIAGPTEWGFTGYEYSGVDRDAGLLLHPDRRAHGDTPLVAWYLKKLAEYEKSSGKHLLDVFDLHFYPAADGLYGGNAGTDPTKSDLRVRSTRALWDPSYLDESWIADKVRLIPRMKDWVKENHPGLKLSLGEWCFGADDHISGGLATAEALGRFGQQGLDAAFHWGELKAGTPSYWAFRAFRNFDDKGGRFQDISLATRELENVSLFASRDRDSTRLVMIVVNRDQTKKVTGRIAFQGCGGAVSSRLFSYAVGSKALTEEPSQVADGAVVVALEPFSFAVLDVRLGKSE